jgi:threonine synthase
MHITRLINKGENLTLDIFIGEKINPEKKAHIQKYNDGKTIVVHQVPRPLQSLHKLCTDDDSVKSLRQSTDDTALTGYYDVAEELTQIHDLCAVFIPTSSGTTAQALHEYFKVHKKDVEIHIVQTTSCHPLALEFDMPETSEQSLATAIVDITAHRKIPVTHAIKDSNGNGWVATNSDIQKAQDILKKYAQVDASANGALGLAGLIRALSKGRNFNGPVVCIVTGK